MAEFGILEKNKEYELLVVDAKDAQGQYTSKVGNTAGQLIYCHHLILQDEDGIRYRCQLCEGKDTQNYCDAGDMITVKVKTFTYDIHTIDFISREGRKVTPTAYLPSTPIGKELCESEQIDYSKTAKGVALQAAAIFMTNRIENKDEGLTVIQVAKKFEDYLIS